MPYVKRPSQTSLVVACIAVLLLTASLAAQNIPKTDQNLQAVDTWRIGVVVAGGFAPDYQVNGVFRYQEELLFYTAGLQVAHGITSPHGPGILRGKSEAIVEIDPLWLNLEPRQVDVIQNITPFTTGTFPGYRGYGIDITPLLLRWTFQNGVGRRLTPWVQGGAGVLWTASRFPQGGGPLIPHSNTSRINFTPQAGIGESIRLRKNSSIDVGARFVLVDSAGVGEYDPGVTSLQFILGYSWRRK